MGTTGKSRAFIGFEVLVLSGSMAYGLLSGHADQATLIALVCGLLGFALRPGKKRISMDLGGGRVVAIESDDTGVIRTAASGISAQVIREEDIRLALAPKRPPPIPADARPTEVPPEGSAPTSSSATLPYPPELKPPAPRAPPRSLWPFRRPRKT